jgi:hypothetical protein
MAYVSERLPLVEEFEESLSEEQKAMFEKICDDEYLMRHLGDI